MADSTGLVPEVVHRFRAMASQVTVRVLDPTAEAPAAVAEVEDVFRRIERTCTRFDPTSDLMRANARGIEETAVGPECLGALQAAFDAHVATAGLFDPRVLRTLEDLGYDRSLDFEGGVVTRESGHPIIQQRDTWRPRFDLGAGTAAVGDQPIDLGGIGKGYAVRLGIALVRGTGRAALVEAGGDLATFGDGPIRPEGERRAWRAGVESPFGRSEESARAQPAAVLDASDAGLATSSVRLRSWRSGTRDVHHLIDPRTGRPAYSGLASVTVLSEDPAWAEVWTKVGFVLGRDGIADFMGERGFAALWIDTDGFVHVSPALEERVLWSVPRVE